MVHRAPVTPALRRRNAIRITVATLCIGTLAAVTTGIVALYHADPRGGAVTEAALGDRTAERAARGAGRITPSAAPTSAAARPSAVPVRPPAPPSVGSAPRTTSPTVVAGCGPYSGNRRTACSLLPSFGFSTSQMPALDKLWEHESNWNHLAENPSSGAYGIPQALPGSKMASVADDWRTNPVTQIRWGLGYIEDRYGSPAAAWSFWQANNWY